MDQAVGAVARLLSRVAAIFLLAMVAINVVDVGLRSGFNQPIFGTYEIVELFLAAVAFLVIPETFLRGGHITIELIDQVVSRRALAWLKVFGTGFTLVFLGLLTFHMIRPALDLVEFNEVSFDLHLPLIYNGALIFTGVAVSVVAVLSVFVHELRAALGGEGDAR